MAQLRCFTRPSGMLTTAVAGAFDEMNARDGWKSHEIVQGEDEGSIHQAVKQQTMRARVKRGNARVMALEMKRGRRDDAVKILKRCSARTSTRCGRGPEGSRRGLQWRALAVPTATRAELPGS
jgi:hypothetical protein